MTVLTQDQSRQFLASASAKDKYTVRLRQTCADVEYTNDSLTTRNLCRPQFFLRGTQLAQLTEEYEQIRSNTEAMDEALQNKRERVPELKEAYRRAKERAKAAQLAWDQQQSLEPLRNQLAWACVDEVEKVRCCVLRLYNLFGVTDHPRPPVPSRSKLNLERPRSTRRGAVFSKPNATSSRSRYVCENSNDTAIS